MKPTRRKRKAAAERRARYWETWRLRHKRRCQRNPKIDAEMRSWVKRGCGVITGTRLARKNEMLCGLRVNRARTPAEGGQR